MAQQAHLGKVGQHRFVIDVNPTITAGPYSLADAVGGLLTFNNATFGSGETGVIESLRIVDRASQEVALELFLFDQTFTATADNAAFAISDADMEFNIDVIPVPASVYYTLNANSVASVPDLYIPFRSVGTTPNIYGQLVTRGTPTYVATSDLRVRLTIRRD